MKSISSYCCLILLLSLSSLPAQAVLTIDITQGAEGALPIAIVPFGVMGMPPSEDIAAIVRDDLQRSGRFAALPWQQLQQRPALPEQVDFTAWRSMGMQYLVTGQVTQEQATGRYGVEFYLFNVSRGDQLKAFRFDPADSKALRRIAHKISDIVYEILIGEKGVFDSRIAYIVASGAGKSRSYRLMLADADGAGSKQLLATKEPLLSPSWSPDGLNLAYVSLENKRTAVYLQNITTGKRQQIAAWPGLNGAPSWSPDGRRLALSLSRDGNPEIYILDLLGRQLSRLTQSPAIDTEPTWAPDGQSLVFTSDRGGRPQLYRISVTGGSPQRITFSGRENAGAEFSKDGSKLAFLHDNQVAVMDMQSMQVTVLGGGGLDDAPSFAPNGQLLVYASGSQLMVVSADGRVRQALANISGEAREPAWSPLNN